MVLKRSIVYVFVDRSSEQGQATGNRQQARTDGDGETEAGGQGVLSSREKKR